MMRRLYLGFVLLLFTSFAFASPAKAHTPIDTGDNESLESATIIPDATKSWASYSELHESDEAQYFRFDAAKGDSIPISLYTSPADEEVGFAPDFALLGPGLDGQGTVPHFIEVPPGAETLLVTGERPEQATFEAFAPSTFVEVAQMTFEPQVDGTYYVAVFDEERGGRYGVAIGLRETSTLYEWITNPLAFPAIYAWEGQNLLLVYLPALLSFVLGLLILLRSNRRLDLAGWVAAIAGLLFIASGVTVASQLIVSLLRASADGFVIVTIFLATIPIILGLLTLRVAAQNSQKWRIRSRTYLITLGVLALFLWTGWIVGPVLAIGAAFISSSTRSV